MFRKTVLALATVVTLGAAALVPTAASAFHSGHGHGYVLNPNAGDPPRRVTGTVRDHRGPYGGVPQGGVSVRPTQGHPGSHWGRERTVVMPSPGHGGQSAGVVRDHRR